MKDGDKYEVLVECTKCHSRRIQYEMWGPCWEVKDCECGGRSQTVRHEIDDSKNIHAPNGCMLTWYEEPA